VYFGKVWPGKSAFPDWSYKGTEDYWINQLTSFKEILDFDGIWNDMNEISNFRCETVCNPD
jgi:alpha-glucosidase